MQCRENSFWSFQSSIFTIIQNVILRSTHALFMTCAVTSTTHKNREKKGKEAAAAAEEEEEDEEEEVEEKEED